MAEGTFYMERLWVSGQAAIQDHCKCNQLKLKPPCFFPASSISTYILLDKREASVLVAFLWEMERSGTEWAVFRL